MTTLRHQNLSHEQRYAVAQIPEYHQSYQLLIEKTSDSQIRFGSFGQIPVKAGFYVYTGSAKRGIRARLRRHLSSEKLLHWHIDYLLAEPDVRVLAFRTTGDRECVLAQSVNGEILAERLGATDCISGCRSHLVKVPTRMF